MSEDRDARQKHILAWARAAFGEEQATSLPQRGLRLLEEAAESAQAAGADVQRAHRVVDHVFGRPVGELRQELGGVGVTLLAIAAAAGLSADAEELREVDRVLSRPIEEFTRRNAAKNAAGLMAAELGEAGVPGCVREVGHEGQCRVSGPVVNVARHCGDAAPHIFAADSSWCAACGAPGRCAVCGRSAAEHDDP